MSGAQKKAGAVAMALAALASAAYLTWDATGGAARPVEPWPEMSDMKLVPVMTGWKRPVDPSPERVSPLPTNPELAGDEIAKRVATRECGNSLYDELVHEEGGRAYVPRCFDARDQDFEDGSNLGDLEAYVEPGAAPVVYERGASRCVVNLESTSTVDLCLADRY